MSQKTLRLFIGNIPWNMSSEGLRQYFEQFGKVAKAHVFFDKTTGLSRRHGMVDSSDSTFLQNVHRAENHVINGSNLSIQISDSSASNNDNSGESNYFKNTHSDVMNGVK